VGFPVDEATGEFQPQTAGDLHRLLRSQLGVEQRAYLLQVTTDSGDGDQGVAEREFFL
jgi:hypothetical protein